MLHICLQGGRSRWLDSNLQSAEWHAEGNIWWLLSRGTDRSTGWAHALSCCRGEKCFTYFTRTFSLPFSVFIFLLLLLLFSFFFFLIDLRWVDPVYWPLSCGIHLPSPCQDPAGNRTTWRSPDDRKKTQTAVVWSCFPFIRTGQNHLARHSERGEEDKADKGRGGKTTSGNGRAWSSASPRGRWRTGKNGENWLQKHLWCPNDPCG